MQLRWIWIAVLCGLAACSPKGPGEAAGGLDLSGIELPSHDVHTAGELKGKVEPWLLERDTTYVRLSDYFPNTSAIDSVASNVSSSAVICARQRGVGRGLRRWRPPP